MRVYFFRLFLFVFFYSFSSVFFFFNDTATTEIYTLSLHDALPIDFQVREPVSPLFGGLRRTNQAIELEITQEYTGQQRHLCFLVPMWKEVLDFDLHANEQGTPVKDLVAGRAFHRPTGGFVGVANVG